MSTPPWIFSISRVSRKRLFEIFGAPESERIPDCVFDQASHVEFIDMEPEQLQNRLKQGCGARIPSAGCTLSQLNALRELGLRRCADRSALYASTQPAQSQALYRMQEHILVCLSSAPSNAQVIRTAAPYGGRIPVRLYCPVRRNQQVSVDAAVGSGASAR